MQEDFEKIYMYIQDIFTASNDYILLLKNICIQMN